MKSISELNERKRFNMATGEEAMLKFILQILLSPIWVPLWLLERGANFVASSWYWLTTDKNWYTCWRA